MKNFVVILSFICYIASISSSAQHLASPPNIILILSDDQDIELHGMHPLQQTLQLFKMFGSQFTHAFTTSPICCPSRASLLSGQYAHNHKTFNNSLNGGCNGEHWREKFEPRALPVLLKQHNYQTFYAGKYLNQYKGAEVPPGWQEFHGLHGNSRYYNYTLRENAQNVSYTDTYLTDLLTERAANFIRNAIRKKPVQQPFFAMIAPPAAHEPFTPAPRHAGSFADVYALRTPSFNVPHKDKHWLVGSSKHLSNAAVSTIDTYFQKRWETLLSVDEMMTTLVAVLNETQSLANTYIIYTSDNGYHLGQFAQPFDKRQPYETDIKVPLLVMGPDVPKNQFIHIPVSLLDLAPTILEWAGILVPDYMDGRSFKEELVAANKNLTLQTTMHERTLLIEYWGEGNDETFNPLCPWQRQDHLSQCSPVAECHCQDAWNNTYGCVRDFRYNLDRIYCEFQDTEHFVEVYDLSEDPYQLTNIVNDILPIEQATYSILLDKLRKCAGKKCSE
ncbi:N-acetylglucosamine-6-sulfatase-like isoform X1 [Drosophila albomicans]|uniref:N-acetylglucosamine-6-sulfatase-like isoform X1 n=1 Tax=Drosophila albomicans TaxID=7291 RepID=A0A6P8XY08_DROAB|nr:N-acetylglucosamine-6-sulfatase-like isoform X1 [Drosophila albomicans]